MTVNYHKSDLTVPQRLQQLYDIGGVSLEEQLANGWSETDHSPNISILNDKLTFRRAGTAESCTDGIRSNIGYTSGLHAWSVYWPEGPHSYREQKRCIGVATSDTPVQTMRDDPLLGGDENSWGLDIYRKTIFHNINADPTVRQGYTRFCGRLPESFHMILDMDDGTLAFVAYDHHWGVAACDGIKGKKLYAAASVRRDNCDVKLEYLGCVNGGQNVVKEHLRSMDDFKECYIPVLRHEAAKACGPMIYHPDGCKCRVCCSAHPNGRYVWLKPK